MEVVAQVTMPADLEIALEPGEVGLYVRYGLLPAVVPGTTPVAITGFQLRLLYEIEPSSGFGVLKPVIDPATPPTIIQMWPLLVIELQEALTAARHRRHVTYSVSPHGFLAQS